MGKSLYAVTLGAWVVAGCVSLAPTTQPKHLIGTWSGPDADTFVFESNGQGRWIFARSNASDTFPIHYRAVQRRSSPPSYTLDMWGFETGFLKGRVLLCIVETASPSQMRMDCEPGQPGEESKRPSAFTGQTKLYQRAR